MTSAVSTGEEVSLSLSKAEALVFFEWLSRNWEKTRWENAELFSDPAEKQVLIWLEADLSKVLAEPFDLKYDTILQRSYRDVAPDPKEWGQDVTYDSK